MAIWTVRLYSEERNERMTQFNRHTILYPLRYYSIILSLRIVATLFGIAYLMIYGVDWMAPSSTSGYVRIGDQLDTRQTRQTLEIFLKDLVVARLWYLSAELIVQSSQIFLFKISKIHF